VWKTKALCPSARIVLFTRDAEHSECHHGVAETITWEGASRGSIISAVAELDLLILGGGGGLYDREARRYLQLVEAAQERGIGTFGFAVGAGPLQDPEDREIVRTTLNRMTDLVVRDQESKLVLEDVGVDREITVTADPALLLPREEFTQDMLVREGVPTGVRLVAMSVREPGRAAEHLEPAGLGAAVGAAAAGADVILVERYGFLGGNATVALVMPLMSFHNEKKQAAPGESIRLLPTDHGEGEPVVAPCHLQHILVTRFRSIRNSSSSLPSTLCMKPACDCCCTPSPRAWQVIRDYRGWCLRPSPDR
jgi:hypothetical protein